MTLSEYLETAGKTATELAIEARCAVSTITRAAKGETIPGRSVALRIYEATGQQVPPNSYYGLAT